jgi:hypothetical protein
MKTAKSYPLSLSEEFHTLIVSEAKHNKVNTSEFVRQMFKQYQASKDPRTTIDKKALKLILTIIEYKKAKNLGDEFLDKLINYYTVKPNGNVHE